MKEADWSLEMSGRRGGGSCSLQVHERGIAIIAISPSGGTRLVTRGLVRRLALQGNRQLGLEVAHQRFHVFPVSTPPLTQGLIMELLALRPT